MGNTTFRRRASSPAGKPNTAGLRPNIVYWPDRTEGETATITHAMRAAVEGRPYEMPFQGEMRFQHIDEVTDILLRCLHVKPTKPIVSDLTTETRSVADLIAAIRAVLPEALVTAAAIYNSPEGLDNAHLRELLGKWPSISLEKGTRRTIETLRV